jgi:hypothetical protein
MLKKVQKEIAALEKKLAPLREVEKVLLGGAAPSARKGAAKPKRAARKPKAAAVKVAKVQARAAKRVLTDEHGKELLQAIGTVPGSKLLAIALKGRIDGRKLRAIPVKSAVAALRAGGYITVEGAKRQTVYVRTDKPFEGFPKKAPKAKAATPAAWLEAAPTNGASAHVEEQAQA